MTRKVPIGEAAGRRATPTPGAKQEQHSSGDSARGPNTAAGEGTGGNAPSDQPSEQDDRAQTAVISRPEMEPASAPTHRRPSFRKRAGLLAVVLVLAVGAGLGGYLVGERGGEDVDAARAAGERQGKSEGEASAAKLGYREGFIKGRKAGYARTYDKAYIRAYRNKFEEAGLAIPENVKVPRVGRR